MRLELPYEKSSVWVEVPAAYSVEIVVPNEIPVLSDPDILIKKALQNPIGREKLRNLLQPSDVVSIIVSDATRPIPTQLMLQPLLKNLKAANIEKENIRIIFGLGIHRKQTTEEKISIVGKEIFQEYQCIDHDTENCINLGTTSRGTPIEVFRSIVESDIVICTGNIEHHYFAGYTGGYKSVLPAVSSRRSIEVNHSLMIEPGTAPGNPECPVRADLEEAGKITGVDFILNVVLNPHKEIVAAVAGHPVEAHRRGAEIVDAFFKRDVEPADIMIVSPGGWPKDINLFQSHKSLEHVKSAVKPGGAIILAAKCAEGLGNSVFEEWLYTTSGPEEAIERFNYGFIQGGHKAALIAKLALDYHLYLVSDLPVGVARKTYFTPASSVQEAFDITAPDYGDNAKVVIVPFGGSTLLAKKELY